MTSRDAWICGALAAHLVGTSCLSIPGGWSFDATASEFVQCDHHLPTATRWLVQEVVVSMRSVQFLTWGTLLAALLSAVLLAGEDAALPDLVGFPGGDPPALSR